MKTAALTLILALLPGIASAVTLAELAKAGPPKLFVAAKGAVMPNSIDQTNNLQIGDKALLLSGQGLTDLTGLSTLLVDDGGQIVPIAAVANLHVFLNRNEIAAIPDEIGTLDRVKFLYFERNRLARLPHTLADMDALEGMYFTDNRFTEIPAFVFGMTRLKKLQFSKNKITTLPAAIGNLRELRHFNMAGNRIAAIPETVANFHKLRVCDLSDNPIAALPEAFGRVAIVNQLRVRNCPLTTLPAGFAKMPGTIDITGTKIDPATLSSELRARIGTEKPPGSKPPEKIIVQQPDKPAKKERPR
jgi:Leucine-rich repeat (LRR) protein